MTFLFIFYLPPPHSVRPWDMLFDDDLQTSQSMPRVQAITDDIPEPMMMDLGCDGKGVGMFRRAYRKSQGKDDVQRNGFDIAMENDRKHGRQVTFYFFLYS